ncbi:type I glyceraldehyde-3-phosphate dehydrogenase [Rhodospirillaceae bacterium AH-315-P19]|nr:type I glyceraldehyde-3-phosphate dehydrogenase [Rhodospirillaceae bacterium AH-315-P19]
MTIRIGINGFGRIGRLALRAIVESTRDDLRVVGINDLGPVETNAHLLRYDSVHGRFPTNVKTDGNMIDVGQGPMRVTAEREPKNLAWGDLNVDVVMECTGRFLKREMATQHLEAGARKVLLSAPASDPDLTVVYGVNHERLEAGMTIVSNASCTTNCLAPVADVLHKTVGIEKGFMTTVHSYTSDQHVVDGLHKDLRRARAAATSMIPTSTGAARAVALVLPELKGKLDGTAIRVPTANVSMIDLTFLATRKTSIDAINTAMCEAANGRLKGVLAVTDEPLVSTDFNHDTHSATLDLLETQVVGGTLVRILAWYDNEWGFANRMLDTAAYMGSLS